MYELYQNISGGPGTLAEVYIDRDAGLVKKLYKENAITISGKPTKHNLDKIRSSYETEIHWSTKLQSDLVVRMLDYGMLPDHDGWFIIQEYHGPDLLHYYRKDTKLAHVIPDAVAQIEEMFQFWQEHGVYKINNAMANMTMVNGKIKAFDFKFAEQRNSDNVEKERHSIAEWVSKIDPTLVERLERYL